MKLADRICNLHGVPAHWPAAKVEAYRTEADLIVDTLGSAHATLSARLPRKIKAYPGPATR